MFLMYEGLSFVVTKIVTKLLVQTAVSNRFSKASLQGILYNAPQWAIRGISLLLPSQKCNIYIYMQCILPKLYLTRNTHRLHWKAILCNNNIQDTLLENKQVSHSEW